MRPVFTLQRNGGCLSSGVQRGGPRLAPPAGLRSNKKSKWPVVDKPLQRDACMDIAKVRTLTGVFTADASTPCRTAVSSGPGGPPVMTGRRARCTVIFGRWNPGPARWVVPGLLRGVRWRRQDWRDMSVRPLSGGRRSAGCGGVPKSPWTHWPAQLRSTRHPGKPSRRDQRTSTVR